MNEQLQNERILNHLMDTDIFADIPSAILQQNIERFRVMLIKPGELILQKGEIGDTMFVIISGDVKVHENDFVVATLHEGDYFGEMSLLHAAPRSMSVSALNETELICVDQYSFYNILKEHPELIQKIISHLVIRLRSQNNTLIDELRSREDALKQQVEEQTRLYREQKERAEQSEKFKQQFLANMSHEIRTPMNAVMGMTSLLMDKNPRTDQIDYLEGIRKSSEILLYIINDILDLSKIEAGKMELEHIDFSLSELIDQVKQTLKHKAAEKNLELRSEIDADITDILVGDPVRINQVIMNLAGNAIKFTEEGSVCISLSNTEKKDGRIGINFAVKDTGIGIPASKLESVFEGFSQANASDTRKFGGTGLGLTISKQLVEMMGGKIRIESKEAIGDSDTDHGTTFSFTLQFETGSIDRLHKRILAEEHVDGSILDGLRILVVDDNEYNRIVAFDTLQSKATLTVTTAESAREAFELMLAQPYDVVLMDLQMPEMDGYAATRYIREQMEKPHCDVPIIALTASVLRHDLDKCLQAGMNAYIAKPFKASQLIAGIATPLGIEIRHKKNSTKNTPLSAPTPTVINLDYLKQFCEGDTQRMKKYIDLYCQSVPAFTEKIETALSSQDREEIANQVHACRTRLAMMGMEDSRNSSTLIEKICRSTEDPSIPTEAVLKLLTDMKQAVIELKSVSL